MSKSKATMPGSQKQVVTQPRQQPLRELYELTNAAMGQSGRRRWMTPKEASDKNRDFADQKWPERWKAV